MKIKHFLLIVIVAVSTALSGCGGGGGGYTPSNNLKTTKSQRHALAAEDISVPYKEGLVIIPRIDNIMGTLTFELLESAQQNTATLSEDGDISVFKPGTLSIKVTDNSSVFETSTTIFQVEITKAINSSLRANPVSVPVMGGDKESITVQGAKGKVTFRVADESTNLLEIDKNSGQLNPLSVGTATVTIEDSGNEKYQPATTQSHVTIMAVAASEPGFANLMGIHYSENLVLSPTRLSDNDAILYRYAFLENSDTSVVDLNPETGLMIVKKTGETAIEVTAEYSDNYQQHSKKSVFVVEILPGLRDSISVESNPTLIYEPGKIVKPIVYNAIATPHFEVIEDSEAIEIDQQTGFPVIKGVGQASLRVTDADNTNYPGSSYNFYYSVHKAPHPGLKANTVYKQTYSEGLQISPEIKGQIGALSFEGGSGAVSISDDTLTVSKAGKTELNVTDSGNKYYHRSEQATVTLDIQRAPHPSIAVNSINIKYNADTRITLADYVSGNKGQLVVDGTTTGGIVGVSGNGQVIWPLKAGSTNLVLTSSQSDNYLASTPITLPVTVNKADATLTVSGDVSGRFSDGVAYVSKPAISGAHGELTYAFAPGAATDVVKLDTEDGSMKVVNAGVTRIVVADSGNHEHQGASVSFNVTVDKAKNPLAINYPTSIFSKGETVSPVLENSTKDMAMTFSLLPSPNTPVKLANSQTGELEMLAGGDYSLEVSASSRNYAQATIQVNGTVSKADHPGITSFLKSIEFAPHKSVKLGATLPPSIGKRVYSLHATMRKGVAEIDPNTGELTLLDFGDKTVIGIAVSESGDDNFKPLSNTRIDIAVTAPKDNQSHRDYTLVDNNRLTIPSRLNAPEFASLKANQVAFSGLRSSTGTPTDQLGVGAIVIADVIPAGAVDTYTNRKQIMLFAQRFDGCESDYSEESIQNGNADAIAMDADGSCNDNGSTNRYITLQVIDDSPLSDGEWETVNPFVIYRHGARAFSPSAEGGFYSTDDDTRTGLEEASEIYEWNRVTLRYSKS